jgi:catechol-2,3-dioxygenase
MKSKFIASTIWAEDLKEASNFYTNIIGLEKIQENRSDRLLFKLGENQYLFIIKGTPSQPMDPAIDNFPVVAFRVDNIETTFENLTANGIKALNGIESLAELTKEL